MVDGFLLEWFPQAQCSKIWKKCIFMADISKKPRRFLEKSAIICGRYSKSLFAINFTSFVGMHFHFMAYCCDIQKLFCTFSNFRALWYAKKIVKIMKKEPCSTCPKTQLDPSLWLNSYLGNVPALVKYSRSIINKSWITRI